MDLSLGAGELLRLIRRSGPLTRADVGERTSWARATVNARIEELLAAHLLRVVDPTGGARGRPAARFAFDAARGDLLVADVGASAARIARCDLDGRVIAQTRVALWIGDGPDVVLDLVTDRMHQVRAGSAAPVWGVGISLPGPIEHSAGRVVSPPIMTGWDGLSVSERLSPLYGVDVLVENDANAMAWGEHVTGSPRVDDLLLVKVGTGVGAGIVGNGRILRGAQGSAGDLGHTVADSSVAATLARSEPPLCRCGKVGCVEAYAGGWAIARDLTADGEEASSVDDVLRLLAAGNAHTIRRVRDAGRILGANLAYAVSMLNPSEIVVAGQLAVAGEHLLAGIREHVAAKALPLATRDLRIRVSDMPNEAGVAGLADALAEWVLSPERLPRGLRLSTAGSGA